MLIRRLETKRLIRVQLGIPFAQIGPTGCVWCPPGSPSECSPFLRYDARWEMPKLHRFVHRHVRHSALIEVAAESLYEAAALAVSEFRRHPWTDGMEPAAVTGP